MTPSEFWAQVQVDGPTTCWPWSGSLNAKGYGRLSYRLPGRKFHLAHRVAYWLTKGEIPEGYYVDHTCHNRACCNPAHLQAVTPKLNNENRAGPTRGSRTGIRGVHWYERDQRYRVRAKLNGREVHGGYFDTLEEAEAAAVALRNRCYTNNLRDRQESA